MHLNEPYWIAVFASVGAEELPFSRPTSCLQAGTHLQCPARRHPADAEPLLLLLVPVLASMEAKYIHEATVTVARDA